MKTKKELYPVLTNRKMNCYQVTIWYQNKRFRYSNGNAIGVDIRPNVEDLAIREERANLLRSAFEIEIAKGWRPKFKPTPKATRPTITEVVERCQAQWVLFDDFTYRTYREFSPLLPKTFRISEHAFLYDAIINLPVPETHYLTTVSIAMKNVKGFLKQEDKPLFHRVDLSRAVVELNKIIKPSLT